MAISDEKYVATTTFRKSGVPVSTATWIIPLGDGRVGFWTSSGSGKAKRLRSTPRIVLQPADARGRAKEGSVPVSGTVELTSSGPEFDEVQRLVRAKYGVMVPITRFLNTLGHLGNSFPYGDLAVVVTLADADG
jgi:PPOX class probable F420-dependent enzyme